MTKKLLFIGKVRDACNKIATLARGHGDLKIFPAIETFTFAGVGGWKRKELGSKFTELCPTCGRVAGNVTLGGHPEDPGAVYESWNCSNCKSGFETRIDPDGTIYWRAS